MQQISVACTHQADSIGSDSAALIRQMTQQFLGRVVAFVTLPTSLGRHLPFCPLNDFCYSLVLALHAPIHLADSVPHRQQQPRISPDQSDQRQRDYGDNGVNVHAYTKSDAFDTVDCVLRFAYATFIGSLGSVSLTILNLSTLGATRRVSGLLVRASALR